VRTCVKLVWNHNFIHSSTRKAKHICPQLAKWCLMWIKPISWKLLDMSKYLTDMPRMCHVVSNLKTVPLWIWRVMTTIYSCNMPQINLDEGRGAVTRVNLDGRTLTQAHQYIMFNSGEFLQLHTWVVYFFKTSYFILYHYLWISKYGLQIECTWTRWGKQAIETDCQIRTCTNNIKTNFVIGTVTT